MSDDVYVDSKILTSCEIPRGYNQCVASLGNPLPAAVLIELYVALCVVISLYGGSIVTLILVCMIMINFGWALFMLLEISLIPLMIYTICGGGYERNSATL